MRRSEETQGRAFIGAVGVLRVIEESHEFEVFLLGNGIVLVSVTLGTRHRSAHPNGHGGVGAIDDGRVAKLFVAGAAFIIGHRVPMERGGDQLLLGRVLDEISGDLFDGELIERFVVVEGFDDIIPIAPDGSKGIIGIPG